MTIYTGAYVGARSCTSGPQPGAWGALDYYLSAYKSKGAVSDGIYNCRSVRGGRTTSIHGEGRAIDMGVRPASQSWATALANAIVAMSKELGVQCVIWNRRIWSSAYPHSGWRAYHGVDPHTLHLHVELTWASARQGRAEAAKKWAKVLGGIKPGDVKIGGGGGSSNTYVEIKGDQLIKLYTKGEPVKNWQKRALGYTGKAADGYFGPDSVADTKKLQKQIGLKGKDVDGMVGPKTREAWSKAGEPKLKASKNTTPKKGKAPTGPKYAFPYKEKGAYIGPKSGPNRSHSGIGGRKTAGVLDSTWNKRFVNALIRRGWNAKKGGTYLTKYGNDGKYGSELAALIKAFQKDQGLAVDGLAGKSTWDAAFNNPIT